MEEKVLKPIKKRKLWFKALKKMMRMRYKRPAFVFLDGEKGFKLGSIILSNHEGTDAPMSLEIYTNKPIIQKHYKNV